MLDTVTLALARTFTLLLPFTMLLSITSANDKLPVPSVRKKKPLVPPKIRTLATSPKLAVPLATRFTTDTVLLELLNVNAAEALTVS